MRPDTIICFELKQDYIIDIPDQKEVNQAIEELGSRKKHCVLFIESKYTTYSQDAIKNSLAPENFKYILADATVIRSLNQRLLADFYEKVMKPPVPSKYFESEEEAVKWLLTFIKNKSSVKSSVKS